MSLTIDSLVALYNGPGASWYHDTGVSHRTHALQCAWIAEHNGAAASVVFACLLHDIGHLLQRRITDLDEESTDDVDALAVTHLRHFVAEDVLAPIRLHSIARRYLASIDAAYLDTCTPVARREVLSHGGPLEASLGFVFRCTPGADEAIELCQYDDKAHVPNLPTPDFTYFYPLFQRFSLSGRRHSALSYN